MKTPDTIFERMQKEMREMTENPELAKGTVGTVVFGLLRAGEDVSMDAIISKLEAISAGTDANSGLNEVLARGALKVIADLRGGGET